MLLAWRHLLNELETKEPNQLCRARSTDLRYGLRSNALRCSTIAHSHYHRPAQTEELRKPAFIDSAPLTTGCQRKSITIYTDRAAPLVNSTVSDASKRSSSSAALSTDSEIPSMID